MNGVTFSKNSPRGQLKKDIVGVYYKLDTDGKRIFRAMIKEKLNLSTVNECDRAGGKI